MRHRVFAVLGLALALVVTACSNSSPTSTSLAVSTTTIDDGFVPVPKASEISDSLPTTALLEKEMFSNVKDLTAQEDFVIKADTDLSDYPWAGEIRGGIARSFTFSMPDETTPHRARILMTVFIYPSQEKANAAVAAARSQYKPVAEDGRLAFGQVSFVYGFTAQAELPAITGAIISHGLIAAEVLFEDSLLGYDWRKGAARILELAIARIMKDHPGLEG